MFLRISCGSGCVPRENLLFLNRSASSGHDSTGRAVFTGSNPTIVRDALVTAFTCAGAIDLASLLISLAARSLHTSPTVAALSTAAHLLGNGSLSFDAYAAAMRCCAHLPLAVSAKSARLTNEGPTPPSSPPLTTSLLSLFLS